jgi:drug/metabolite transporter (DMT)-like permease
MAMARTLAVKSSPRGIALMLLALFALTCSDALTKWLGASYPLGQVVCMRALFALLPAAVMIALNGGLASLAVHNVAGQAQRALVFTASTTTIALSFILLPIADAAAILYAGPLFITALAYPMLRERVGWQRWCAVLIGFCGVVVMLRPTAGAIQLLGLVPLLGAFLASLRDVYSRRLSATETNNSMMFWSSITLIVLSGLSAFFGWQPIGLGDLVLMAAAGCCSGMAQFMILEAYRSAEASVVAPIKYTGIVWAAIVGYVVWRTLPDAFILMGSAIVIGSGLFILRAEMRAAKTSIGR